MTFLHCPLQFHPGAAEIPGRPGHERREVRQADGRGRVGAVEVMINSPNNRELITKGKASQIEKPIVPSSDSRRMRTFNHA